MMTKASQMPLNSRKGLLLALLMALGSQMPLWALTPNDRLQIEETKAKAEKAKQKVSASVQDLGGRVEVQGTLNVDPQVSTKYLFLVQSSTPTLATDRVTVWVQTGEAKQRLKVMWEDGSVSVLATQP